MRAKSPPPFRAGVPQPSKSVRAALDRMAAAKALNAVVTINAERSLAEAATIDRRLQLGESMPLAGVPIVIKDNIWVDGWRVTQGSRLFSDLWHRATPSPSSD